jgi:hypothetical protein
MNRIAVMTERVSDEGRLSGRALLQDFAQNTSRIRSNFSTRCLPSPESFACSFPSRSALSSTAATTGYFASYYSEDLDSYDYQANITIESIDGDSLSFDITNISISSASAIPEPSTYTALVGLAALGFVAMRRRVAA